MKKKTVMYGNGLYARLIHQKIIEAGSLEIVAFTADWQFMTGDAFRGLPLVPFHEVDKILPSRGIHDAGGARIFKDERQGSHVQQGKSKGI